MLTVESALALFSMLAISSISLFVAQRIHVPHTVFLVGVGVVMAILTHIPELSFFGEFTLTPELLFFIFLPTLIFESAYNINIKQLSRDAVAISVLAIVSLLVSATLIGIGLNYAFAFLGFDIPLILCLVFGAIISATDPVAVLALFKEYGAPRRLSLIFEGESIFNDGTAVALFLILLTIATSGAFDGGDIIEGIVSFVGMVIGGILFGLLFGGFFAKLIGYTRSNEFAAITLTMVLAHTTFICAELFSEVVTIGGHPLHISSIIATATASLLMGNYGRYKLPVHAIEFVEKYWSQFAFLANSLIFIMIGMLAIQLPAAAPSLFIPILIAILVVAAARALSIYPIVGVLNMFSHHEKRIPRAWQHVLAWGSLRGALAVTMVLLVPDTLSFPGWDFAFTPKEFLLTLTVSCVFVTLFVKATTIGSLMGRLRLNTFTAIEEVNYREMLIYIYDATLRKLDQSHEKQYITDETYNTLKSTQDSRIKRVFSELKEYSTDPEILEKVVRLYAIGIERKHAILLFGANEVNERVIRRIMGKLEYQSQAIEHDRYRGEKYEHGSIQDIFEFFAERLRRMSFSRYTNTDRIVDEYLYYRALAIVSRKVVKQLRQLNDCFEETFKMPHETIREVVAVYEDYRIGSTKKMEEFHAEHHTMLRKVDVTLAQNALYAHETDILENLCAREMVTPKVSIALDEHLSTENKEAY